MTEKSRLQQETHQDRSTLVHVGEPVDYSDGSEEELIRIIRETEDLSSRSDELSGYVRDWPTRYHLSRLRSNLLRPLTIEPGLRVVDIGAGTGTLSRYLGEQGASVLAVEGSADRARIAAARCRDLPAVDVVVGDVGSLTPDRPFDLALLVGVLEYAAAPAHGPEAAKRFLDHVAGLISDDGALVLAIENRLGLKYLLGLPEDHLGESGIGVEGYRADSPVQTFHRRQLGALLSECGFAHQDWLFPFPDYKLPTVVVREELYELDGAADVIDRLVPNPVIGQDGDHVSTMNPRRVHHAMVGAGLGPDLANSFLVVASRRANPPLLRNGDLAWLFGDERRSVWLRDRALVREGDALFLQLRRGVDHTEGWLRHSVEIETSFITGLSLEQRINKSLSDHDFDSLTKCLLEWHAEIAAHASTSSEGGAHPFSPVRGERALPGSFLDINLDNFVKPSQGRLVFVDREWIANAEVSFPLVTYRALWYLALGILRSGSPHPWSFAITVQALSKKLAEIVSIEVPPELHERFVVAESEFQALVGGDSSSRVATELSRLHSSARSDLAASLPSVTSLRDEIRRLTDSLREVAAEAEHRQHVIDDLAAEAEHRQHVIDDLVRQRDELARHLAALQSAVERDPITRRIVRRRL